MSIIKQHKFSETKLFKAMVNSNIEYVKVKGNNFEKCQKVAIQKLRRRAFKSVGKFNLTDLLVKLPDGGWSRVRFIINN